MPTYVSCPFRSETTLSGHSGYVLTKVYSSLSFRRETALYWETRKVYQLSLLSNYFRKLLHGNFTSIKLHNSKEMCAIVKKFLCQHVFCPFKRETALSGHLGYVLTQAYLFSSLILFLIIKYKNYFHFIRYARPFVLSIYRRRKVIS